MLRRLQRSKLEDDGSLGIAVNKVWACDEQLLVQNVPFEDLLRLFERLVDEAFLDLRDAARAVLQVPALKRRERRAVGLLLPVIRFEEARVRRRRYLELCSKPPFIAQPECPLASLANDRSLYRQLLGLQDYLCLFAYASYPYLALPYLSVHIEKRVKVDPLLRKERYAKRDCDARCNVPGPLELNLEQLTVLVRYAQALEGVLAQGNIRKFQ